MTHVTDPELHVTILILPPDVATARSREIVSHQYEQPFMCSAGEQFRPNLLLLLAKLSWHYTERIIFCWILSSGLGNSTIFWITSLRRSINAP